MLAVLVLAGAWGLEQVLVPTLLELGRVHVTVVANELITRTITEQIVGTVQYRDLIHFETNPNGDIIYMQANTVEVGRIEMAALSSLQESIRQLHTHRIEIPLGQLTGSRLLATVGPRVPISVHPLAEVRTRVRDDFVAVGINQTRHNILLDVSLRLDIIFPILRTEKHLENTILLSSVIIQGRVPTTYVHIQR
jgi:sporulation protein YunB